ncbi:MAG TPA: 3-hydroxyacyl-CoA dehydrogenase family protein, partial [Gammaproteobacteria bacterium]|nr:3-hydroxyacyl-CoA dehydrogenase family protein [Gammaproteobacteria bacterium]
PVLAKLVRQKLMAKANPSHYPAPFMVLDSWEKNGVDDNLAFAREANNCAKLFVTETSRNLVRVFFLQEKLKGLAKDLPLEQQHVHVIGAGTMGGDIAAWCALRGFKVTLQDIEPNYLTNAFKRASALFKDKLKEPHLVQKAMDSLIPDVAGHGVKTADIIIEAVVEDLEIKRKVFRDLEHKAKPEAILATNTSSIMLDEINMAMASPERLVGIHFFNPVAMMQLVEVVKGEKTDRDVIERALSFVRQIDKLPLPVKSKPGFLVNRVLFPYMMEAMRMLDEGIPASAIDKAMTNFGMPIGPVALADMVGLDVCLLVADHLSRHSSLAISPLLKQMVADKKLGRKTAEGFYRYDAKGKIIAATRHGSSNKTQTEIANRLVLRLINESFQCLREGVVADGDLLDAGMIFGAGFAPFRGGPIHYAKSQGIEELYQQYVKQQEARGEKQGSVPSWV